MLRSRLALGLALGLSLIASGGCDCGGGEGIHGLMANLQVAPASVDFGAVLIGTSSATVVTFTNKGAAVVGLSGWAVDGDAFTIDPATAPPALSPGDSAQLAVTFSPSAAGKAMGLLRFTPDDGKGERSVPLTGVGVVPGVNATPSASCANMPGSLSFGSVPLGQSADATIALMSTGTATVTILSVAYDTGASPEFSLVSPPSGASLAPNATLTVTARFTPSDLTPVTTTLIITTSAPDRPLIRIPVCAAAVQASLCAMPVPLVISGATPMQSMSAPLHLKNCGNQSLSVSAIAISMDPGHTSGPGFSAQPPMLPTNLMPGDGFDVPVTYAPPAAGSASAYLRVDSTAQGVPTSYFPIQAIAAEPCDLTVVPGQLDYWNVGLGASADRRVLAENTNTIACTITRLQVTQGSNVFSVVAPPVVPDAVPPGGSVVLTVRYSPVSMGAADHGVLEIAAGRSVRQVVLNGNAPPQPGCHLSAVPAFLNYGVVGVGVSTTRSFTLNSIGMAACNVTGIALDPGSDPGFMNPTQATGSLTPGQNAVVTVTYAPTRASASAMGTLHVQSNDATTPTLDVALFAQTPAPGICVTPTHLPFGSVMGSRDLSFSIIACGSRDVMLTGLPFTMPDPEFTLPNPPSLPTRIAMGQMISVTVRYTPVGMAGAAAVIAVNSDDPNTPSIPVNLDGGAQIVPPAAGHFLYYWRVDTSGTGDIMRLPLQGMTTPTPYWGQSNGKGCTGCHSLSPDGRYLALVNNDLLFQIQIIDTTNNSLVTLPYTMPPESASVTWRPDVNSNPPYQFAFDGYDMSFNSVIYTASLMGSTFTPLQGASDPNFKQKHPSWGPNGKIAFVRGTAEGAGTAPGNLGFTGTTDVMLVPETGGTATPLAGASGNSKLNYYPSYSPDGRWIAFTVSANGPSTYAAPDAQIRLASADNSGQVLMLANANGPAGSATSFPTWSHDGTLISFSSNRPGGAGDYDIWYSPIDMTGNDGAAVNLTQANTPGFDHVARWSP
jgi:hypothetical protein